MRTLRQAQARFLYKVIAIATFMLAIFASASERPVNSSQVIDQKELLWWLPADTESVVAARGPFPVQVFSAKDDEKHDRNWFTRGASLAEIQGAFEYLPLELFHEFDVEKLLQGRKIAFAVEGSRHFRPPLGDFEVMDFEGCSIVVFEKDLGATGDRLMKEMAGKATNTDLIYGTRVLVFHNKDRRAEWDFFLALPRSDVLLAANNLSYLREVIERMAEKKGPRALPDKLPEWSRLDPAARFWAIRHYDPNLASLDPTSPFGNDRTFGEADKKAIGLLIELDPTDSRRAVITFFSGDKAKIKDTMKAKTIIAEPEEGVKFEVKLNSPTPEVLEHIYTLDEVSTLDYFILNVQVLLGRGMYF